MGIPELEVLNLEHTSLRTLALDEEVVGHLQLLQMDGNPLHCDCHSRWLWNIVATVAQNKSFIQLPNCETPFSAKGIPLSSLPGKQLCTYFLFRNRKILTRNIRPAALVFMKILKLS